MDRETTTAQGNAAEDAALDWLEQQGLRVVERNFRCKMGEIDLIMVDGNVLVFVEVRLRTNPDYMNGAESISRTKIRRLIRTATWYLQTRGQHGTMECRFDVVSLGSRFEWIKEAFTLDD
ncbi:MAG TPA: YraN family protein [Pseudomonadales bacterium]|nr:YraN family protein [Pseudomonadales bacterium]